MALRVRQIREGREGTTPPARTERGREQGDRRHQQQHDTDREPLPNQVPAPAQALLGDGAFPALHDAHVLHAVWRDQRFGLLRFPAARAGGSPRVPHHLQPHRRGHPGPLCHSQRPDRGAGGSEGPPRREQCWDDGLLRHVGCRLLPGEFLLYLIQ